MGKKASDLDPSTLRAEKYRTANKAAVRMHRAGAKSIQVPAEGFADAVPVVSAAPAAGATDAVVVCPCDSYCDLGTLEATLETLLVVLDSVPESSWLHQHAGTFATPAAIALTSFTVAGPGRSAMAVGNDPSSRVIAFTAEQLNAIRAMTADATLVTAASSISYAYATKILTVGSETLDLTTAQTAAAYFLLSSTFGAVTAVGSVVPYLLDSVKWISDPAIAASTVFEFSVGPNKLGVIAGAAI
ncbi:MAG: hypothetical protein WCS18_12125 [Sphaerochaetaceae bacterium]